MVVGISHFDLKRNPINTKLISSAEHQKTSVHLSFISFWHFCAAIKSLSADFIRIKTSPEGRPWWSNTMWTQWVRISVENSARKSRTSSIVATEGRPQRHIQSLTFVGGTNCWHSTGIMGGVGSGMRRAKKKQFNTCWTWLLCSQGVQRIFYPTSLCVLNTFCTYSSQAKKDKSIPCWPTIPGRQQRRCLPSPCDGAVLSKEGHHFISCGHMQLSLHCTLLGVSKWNCNLFSIIYIFLKIPQE